MEKECVTVYLASLAFVAAEKAPMTKPPATAINSLVNDFIEIPLLLTGNRICG
jgi:hypothetical protein